MQSKEVTVRLQALGGQWEVCGRDRRRGIWPENVLPDADGWGSANVTFQLRRDPRAPWPDLGAYTPVEIEIGGQVVWAGRIASTPSTDGTDRVMNVQCKGWQVQLDDNLYEKVYVHTKVSAWRDLRTFPTTDLTRVGTAAGVTSTDNGVLSLGWAKGAQLGAALPYSGVVLDLGPASTAKRIVVTVDCPSRTATAGLFSFAICGGDTENVLATATEVPVNVDLTALPTGGTVTTLAGTFTTARRFVGIEVFYASGAATTAEDDIVRVRTVQVFSDTAYESGNASILKSSTVVTDALLQATNLLSSDLSGITASTFSIPDLVLDGPKTPREVWATVNAYEDRICQIDVRQRPIFKAKPTAPLFEVGRWSPIELEDQSANSGDEIYSRVIVTGTQPDGSPLRVTRIASGTHPVFPFVDRGLQSGAALTPGLSGQPSQTFVWTAGLTYNFTALVMRSATTVTGMTLFLRVGIQTVTSAVLTPAAGTWVSVPLSITPTADDVQNARNGNFMWGLNAGGSGTMSIDAVTFLAPGATLPDRRGFTRTKELVCNGPMTVLGAQRLGDLWLAAHATTPYKGTFKIVGDRAVRDPATGTPVPLEQLLLHTGELIRDTAAIDPDTGGVGRDGRIAAVSYDPVNDEATVTLDNTRASFEALLARLDIVSSAGK